MQLLSQTPNARWPDFLIGMALILWMAESTARLPYQSVLVAAMYASVLARLLLRQEAAVAAILAAIPALPFVAISLVSALWSPVPQISAVAAMQLGFTVLAGAWLGHVFGLRGLAHVIAAALLVSMAASATNLSGFSAPTHAQEGGFLGVYLNKNGLGQRAALLMWTLLYLLQTTQKPGGLRLFWAAGLGLTVWMLVLSASVSSWALAIGGCGALWVLHMRAAGGIAWRICAVGVATLALAGMAFVLSLQANPAVLLLEMAGKDATLTGRTLLWSVAWEEARDAPLVGVGYMAFWADPGNAQQVALLRLVFGPTVSVFHNFALEILVALGPIGVAALLALIGACGARLARTTPGPGRRWAILSLLAFLVLSSLGSSLFRPHEITMLLVVALMTAAASPDAHRRHNRRRAYSSVWRPSTASQ